MVVHIICTWPLISFLVSLLDHGQCMAFYSYDLRFLICKLLQNHVSWFASAVLPLGGIFLKVSLKVVAPACLNGAQKESIELVTHQSYQANNPWIRWSKLYPIQQFAQHPNPTKGQSHHLTHAAINQPTNPTTSHASPYLPIPISHALASGGSLSWRSLSFWNWARKVLYL